ncbi:hypothetical protein JCM6882_000110 [Rhodosporidiobolus microsporus]
MNSSPSSHQLESLNQEDEAASTAGEGVEASPPTSLLDLPDELLASIFDEAYRPSKLIQNHDYPFEGFLTPPSETMINRRLFRLTQPFWPRYLTTPRTVEELDSFLPNLLSRPHILSRIKHLSTDLPAAFPALHSFVISQCAALTSLSLWLLETETNVEWQAVPHVVTDALKKLRHLRVLKLMGWVADLDDPTFSLDEDVPSLRVLDVEPTSVARAVLTNGASRLESLTTRTPDVELPWQALKHLRIELEHQHVEDPDEFVAKLQAAACKGPIPLESLNFAVCLSSPSLPQTFNAHHMCALLGAVAPFKNLRSLAFGLDYDCTWPTAAAKELKVPSVKELALKLDLRNHAAHLPRLLTSFPALHTLRLTSLESEAVPRSPFWRDTGLPTSGALANVLDALRREHPSVRKVLHEGVRDGGEGAWWTREEGEERFVCEGWNS